MIISDNQICQLSISAKHWNCRQQQNEEHQATFTYIGLNGIMFN
jgi:hypothetical protein